MNEKVHVIKDENLGGVLREFVEVDRKAEVGEYIFTINTKEIHKVTKGSEDGVYIDGWVYVYDGYYRTLEPTDIVHIDDLSGQSKRYRMVDREAEVGERIIIIDADIADYLSNYKNGDVFVVRELSRKYRGWVEAVSPNVFDDKIDVILPYEYCVLEPVHDEETSPTVHEMLANLSEQIVKLNRRIDRLADANEQAVSTVARDVERVDADLIKLRKEFEDSKDVKLTLSSELVAKLIEKGMSD